MPCWWPGCCCGCCRGLPGGCEPIAGCPAGPILTGGGAPARDTASATIQLAKSSLSAQRSQDHCKAGSQTASPFEGPSIEEASTCAGPALQSWRVAWGLLEAARLLLLLVRRVGPRWGSMPCLWPCLRGLVGWTRKAMRQLLLWVPRQLWLVGRPLLLRIWLRLVLLHVGSVLLLVLGLLGWLGVGLLIELGPVLCEGKLHARRSVLHC